jgi:hypothetical protein
LEFKLHFQTYAEAIASYVSQPRLRILKAITIGKCIHQMTMRTSKIDMANSVEPVDIDTFINNAAWAIHQTYHKILKVSPGTAQTLEHDTILDVPFAAHW